MSTRDLPPIHPGVTLYENVMRELDLSANQVAQMLGVPANRISEIVRGRRAVTADTAFRLAEWLGTSAEFWMRLQEKYDLEVARMQSGDDIRRQVTQRLPMQPPESKSRDVGGEQRVTCERGEGPFTVTLCPESLASTPVESSLR